MKAKKHEVFLRVSNQTGQHVLAEGQLDPTSPTRCIVHLSGPDLCLEPGMDVLLVSEDAGTRHQTAARIERVAEAADAARLEVSITGDPVPYDRRWNERRSARGCGLQARLDDGTALELLDISTRGFAVRSRRSHRAGDPVDVVLMRGDGRYPGRGIVRSAAMLDDGAMRLGVECVGSLCRRLLLAGAQGVSDRL